MKYGYFVARKAGQFPDAENVFENTSIKALDKEIWNN
jgi:hypothetical protein